MSTHGITDLLTIEGGIAARETELQKNDQIGQADFLKLLVAQLEHQDPLNPQDSTEFTAQLAQFTSLEQQFAMRSSLEQLVAAQTDERTLGSDLQVAGLIGHEVAAIGDQIEIDTRGGEADIHFSLDGPADKIVIRVTDLNGAPVRTLDSFPSSAGPQVESWDGRNDAGQEMAAGVYRFSIDATLGGGGHEEQVGVQSFVVGIVSGTSIGDGQQVVRIGGRVVAVEDIFEVQDRGGAG